jgi:hypothetical protein
LRQPESAAEQTRECRSKTPIEQPGHAAIIPAAPTLTGRSPVAGRRSLVVTEANAQRAAQSIA